MDDRSPLRIRHDVEGRRFVATVDGLDAHVDYRRSDDMLRIVHTEVAPAIGGRGVAAELMRALLEHARAEGLKVVPACSYAATYLERHPEYAALVGQVG